MPMYHRLISSKRDPFPDRQASAEIRIILCISKKKKRKMFNTFFHNSPHFYYEALIQSFVNLHFSNENKQIKVGVSES